MKSRNIKKYHSLIRKYHILTYRCRIPTYRCQNPKTSCHILTNRCGIVTFLHRCAILLQCDITLLHRNSVVLFICTNVTFFTYILCYIYIYLSQSFMDMLHSYIDMSDFNRYAAFLNVEITHCHIVMQYDLTYR